MAKPNLQSKKPRDDIVPKVPSIPLPWLIDRSRESKSTMLAWRRTASSSSSAIILTIGNERTSSSMSPSSSSSLSLNKMIMMMATWLCLSLVVVSNRGSSAFHIKSMNMMMPHHHRHHHYFNRPQQWSHQRQDRQDYFGDTTSRRRVPLFSSSPSPSSSSLLSAKLASSSSTSNNTSSSSSLSAPPQEQQQQQQQQSESDLDVVPSSSSSSSSSLLLQLKEERMTNCRLLMTVDETNYRDVVKLWTDDAVYIEPSFQIQGKEELLYFLERLFKNSDFVQNDYKFDIYDEVYDDNTYMCYWRMYGTFQKKFIWGLYKIHEEFDAKGCSIMKFRKGDTRVYFHRDVYTEGDLWKNVILIGNLVEYLRYLFRSSVTKPRRRSNQK